MANEQNGDLQMSDPQMNPAAGDPQMSPAGSDPKMSPAINDAKAGQINKPGWKTSEFWLTLLAQLFPILESLCGNLKPEYAALISAAAQAFYSYQRYKIKTQ